MEEYNVKNLLSEFNIELKKSLGQNFLCSGGIPQKIAESGKDQAEGVIEIGPGAGALTKELCRVYKKVVAIELDKRMEPVLNKVLSPFNNVTVIYGDVLKTDLAKVIKDMGVNTVAVVANLPYYITTPIIMKLLESELPFKFITVMVQKEVAERLTSPIPGKNVGAVTVAVNYYSKPETLFTVSRGCFVPPPNVDSAVIRLNILKEKAVTPKSEENFRKLVSAAFIHRRKTLVNSLSASLPLSKEDILLCIEKMGLKPTVRAEELSITEFSRLSDLLF